MEAWMKPIVDRVNGVIDQKFAAETVAVKRLWEEYNVLLSNRPTLEATVMTPGQLHVLTLTAQMLGRSSELTREILTAFGLVWGWPDHLSESDRRFESQQVLVSSRPVPVAAPPAPAPAPPMIAPPAPTPTEPLGAAPPTPSGFVELPQTPTPTPAPDTKPEPPTPPPAPPAPPRGERGRGTETAVVTRTD